MYIGWGPVLLRGRCGHPLNRVVKVTLAVILLSLRIPPLKDCRAAYTLAGARAASLLPDGGIILMSPVVCFRKDYGLWWGKTLSHGSPFVDDTECRGYSSGLPGGEDTSNTLVRWSRWTRGSALVLGVIFGGGRVTRRCGAVVGEEPSSLTFVVLSSESSLDRLGMVTEVGLEFPLGLVEVSGLGGG